MSNLVATFSTFYPGNFTDKSNSEIPLPRQGHALVSHYNNLYLFSGRIPGSNHTRAYIHDFWQFNINSKKWLKLNLESDKPTPCERHSHSLCVYKDKIYLFGGSNNQNYLGDLWCHDLDKSEWQLISDYKNKTNDFHATPRHGHTAAIYNDLMIIFGGKHGFNSNEYFNDIYAFDLKNHKWIEFKTKFNELIPQRCWHTFTIINKFNIAVLFGGFRFDSGQEIYYNDTWILNLNNLEWKELKLDNLPHERNRNIGLHVNHLSTLNCEYILYHSGNYMESRDVWLNDLFLLEIDSESKFKWIKVDFKKNTNIETSRGQHAAVYVYDQDEILYFGGEFERQRFNDIISIRI